MLSDDILARCHERAPDYDRENRFFTEDFEELREAGYLKMPVPKEFGGMGMSLAQVCREQRRLAYYAPATAVAINMHLYWVGAAADVWRGGDKSVEWLLRGAVDGEVYAAGHAESGNDIGVMYSSTKAERVPGGYVFTGRKSFGSLTPVWTYLGMHGMVSNGNGLEGAQIVHAFMPRSAAGYTIKETWDTLGMRATRSDDTLLERVYVPDEYIARVLPAGFGGADPFIFSVFAWFLCNIGNIYLCHRPPRPGPDYRERQEQTLARNVGTHYGPSPSRPNGDRRYGVAVGGDRAATGANRRRLEQRGGPRC